MSQRVGGFFYRNRYMFLAIGGGIAVLVIIGTTVFFFPLGIALLALAAGMGAAILSSSAVHDDSA